MIELLTKLINAPFANALYFENLKASRDVPVFKHKGTLVNRDKYHPISLLSIINKFIEKLMHISITGHICYVIDDNDIADRKFHTLIPSKGV